MEDDGGVEDAFCVGAPSTADACDAGEGVRREVVKDRTEYLVRKEAVPEVHGAASGSLSLSLMSSWRWEHRFVVLLASPERGHASTGNKGGSSRNSENESDFEITVYIYGYSRERRESSIHFCFPSQTSVICFTARRSKG